MEPGGRGDNCPQNSEDLESEPVSSNNLLKGKSPLIAQDSIIAFFHILKQNNKNGELSRS